MFNLLENTEIVDLYKERINSEEKLLTLKAIIGMIQLYFLMKFKNQKN